MDCGKDTWVHQGTSLELKGQHTEVSSLFSFGSEVPKSGYQFWWQSLSPTDPSHHLQNRGVLFNPSYLN